MIAPARHNMASVEVLSVNVGLPAPLMDSQTGKMTLTGIVKRPVSELVVAVDTVNIAGDGQADLRNHGGVDKAVYCYSHDHLAAWRQETGYPGSEPAPFGENLSVRGATEDNVRIGDRWQWGEVILEVAQPRWPCFKLGLRSGLPELPVWLIESERSGWYFRVLQPGSAPAAGACLTLVHRAEDHPTVHQAFRAARGLLDHEESLRIAGIPQLAAAWQRIVLTRTQRQG